MMGAAASCLSLTKVPAILAQPLLSKGDRPHYLRGILADGKFITAGLQQSHALFTLSKANALLRMEPASSLDAGASVEVLLL
jgi:molybdopterin molybdotransferase